MNDFALISTNITTEIDAARNFAERLEGIIVNKHQLPTGDRNVLLIAYWALMFDYHKGILSLLQSEFFGAAFALVRPMIEANVRAHVALIGSQEDLRAIQDERYTVNFKRIGPQIDVAFRLDHLMENFLNDVTRSALHSYAHSGLLQLGRRFDGNDLKPNYADDEIIEVIRVATSAIFMVTNLVTKHFGFEEDSQNVGQTVRAVG